MIRTVIILCFISVVCCQYARQRAPPAYDDQPYYEEEEYSPRPQARPQPPPPPPAPARRSTLFKPASVHYVNIGEELAGDYKFGYDTGKGDDGQSFREETRLPDGSVVGAYGYVDQFGKQRIVKYSAGKEGYKVLGDEAGDKAPRSSAPAQPAYAPPQPVQRPPPQAAPVQAYQPPPQPAYRAPPQPVYRVPPQPAPQPIPRPQPQPAYRAPPAPQRSYQPEPPRSRPAPRRQYAPEPVQRPRNAQPDYDYDYPDNEVTERRIVPIDTSLFNYNIGTKDGSKK